MRQHPRCGRLHVATRGLAANAVFFEGAAFAKLSVAEVAADFAFHADGRDLLREVQVVNPQDYDLIWLRLPPPLSPSLLDYLEATFADCVVINDPAGIRITGSKAFLLHFPELCAPMRICRSVSDIESFKNQFPIVLKPFREYGGKGIVRIDGDRVWEGKQETSFAAFADRLPAGELDYLGVKFLQNVDQGDKRIIVVNGEILGASLRLPPPDSWLCNVAMGGSSNPTEPDADEREIVRRIHPELSRLGIVMYGLDTLVGDSGRRVLSEINTTSIGGLPQTERSTGQIAVPRAIDLIWNYFLAKIATTHD
jgi:glutathione synthase